MVEKQLNKFQGEKQMTVHEKMEQAQERIKASQFKDELKYQSTYDKNFHDALYIALHMEIGKEYTFLNSDQWYQPYTITKMKKRIFIAKIKEGFIVLNLKQVINYIKGGRPVIEGEMFSTNREQDINKMLFNYSRYRRKYKGLEINDCGVVTHGAKIIRRYFGKSGYNTIQFQYEWAKYPLDERYYFAICVNNGGGPLTFQYYDISFRTEQECINHCVKYLIERYSEKEEKNGTVIKYLKDLQNYYQMGIEVKYITESKWDEPLHDFEIIGKGKFVSKAEVVEDEEEENEEQTEVETDQNQLSLF